MTRKKATPKRRPGVKPGKGRKRPATRGRSADGRPLYWDHWVTAALLIRNGATQEAAARTIGRRRETLNRWTQDEKWWPLALAEADAKYRANFRSEMDAAVDKALLFHAQKKNAQIATWWKERTDPEFAPRSKHELSGPNGAPIETRDTTLDEMSDADLAKIAAKLAAEVAQS